MCFPSQDLLQPEEEAGFTCMRAPLRDVEEEDIAAHFRPATEFMQQALAGGGKLLGGREVVPP